MSALNVFMFPGQGSQYPGMDAALPQNGGHYARLLADAVRITGVPLDSFISQGPEEVLTSTENAQPALLVADVATARSLTDLGWSADVVMGHSLGEYAALVHAGVLDFDDAVRLVRTRGVLMAQASLRIPGGMLAVIGMQEPELGEATSKAAGGEPLEITNRNAPNQFVVSGTSGAIERLAAVLGGSAAVRVIPLKVSAPFHSSLMVGIADEFSRHLDQVRFSAPKCLFIDNVTGMPEENPAEIRRKLVLQLSQPVQWMQSVQTAVGKGGGTFIECGPGRVLGGLVKRIARGSTILFAEAICAESAPGSTP